MGVVRLRLMSKNPDAGRLEFLQGTLEMLILRTLQWGPQHGHGIGQAIRAQSDDLLKVETGSLYPALHRLDKRDRKSTRLNSSHLVISYAVFCLKKKTQDTDRCARRSQPAPP